MYKRSVQRNYLYYYHEQVILNKKIAPKNDAAFTKVQNAFLAEDKYDKNFV